MNNFFQQLKKEALSTKLSHDEKQTLRVALYDAMRQPRPVAKEVTYTRVRSSYTLFSFISSPRFALPVAVVLIMGLGGGTALASQGSLPGDPLYSIKVNVTEPALGALAIGTEAKAQWHAQVAQTRLEEAEELAASGRLNASTSAELSQDFDDHSSAAQELAQKVEDEEPGSGANLAAQFDSSLEAHNAILARIGNESSSSKQFTDDVSEHVRGHGGATLAFAGSSGGENSFKATGVQTFSATAPAPEAPASSVSDTAPVQTAPAQTKSSLKLKKLAASALSDAQSAFSSAQKTLDASTTLQVQDELARIGATVDAATSTASLTGALRNATVLKAFLKASKDLNRNFFNSDNSGRGSRGQEDGNQDKNKSENSVNVQTNPAPSADAVVQGQVNAGSLDSSSNDTGSGSSHGGDSGGDQSKDGSDDDSFVHNLLNNF